MISQFPQPEILEVTLRDGSYLVDFQFTADDTTLIASALDSAGFRWIEVGHGLGLGATALGKGVAACSDVEYMQAAAQAVQHGRWGMFFIPGIGREEDLRIAAAHLMGFVRIGTNTTEIAAAQPFIELAKELGMAVSYNAMKSYAVPPGEFARCCRLAANWGADIVCLVDSAGGMYPEDVAAYLNAARDACGARLGFHGHDNLALAMANTIRALDCGATLVDSSLQGIGRSAGNTITEVLVAIMQRRGLLPDFNLNTVTDLGQALIQPALRRRGMDPMAVISGAARFHSSFTPKLQAYARQYRVDVRDLIVSLCEHDQVDAPDGLLHELSQQIAAQKLPRLLRTRVFSGNHSPPSELADSLEQLVREIHAAAVKAGKFSAVNIVSVDEPSEFTRVSANVYHSPTHVIGSVAVAFNASVDKLLNSLEGRVDVVLFDIDCIGFSATQHLNTAKKLLQKTLLLTYSDSTIWIDAVEGQVVRLLKEDVQGITITILGENGLSDRLCEKLSSRGALIRRSESLDASECPQTSKLVILWPSRRQTFTMENLRGLQPGTWLLDAFIGSTSCDCFDALRAAGVLPVRVNIWPVLAAALLAAHESARVCADDTGWGRIAGVTVVAGGAIGAAGDIIVDSLKDPTRVLGIADGTGRVLFHYAEHEAEKVRTVVTAINGRRISASSSELKTTI
jgi:4-hydroxy 2-oxovalerate aldolase